LTDEAGTADEAEAAGASTAAGADAVTVAVGTADAEGVASTSETDAVADSAAPAPLSEFTQPIIDKTNIVTNNTFFITNYLRNIPVKQVTIIIIQSG
jgi:hypothetical protein